MNLTNFTYKKSTLIFLFLLATNLFMFGQKCGTKFSAADMQRHYNLMTLNGDYIPQDTCLNKKFSLVIHIVLDSSGDQGITPVEIQQGIDTLNRYFKPICVSFEACVIKEIKDYNHNKWVDTISQPVIELTYHDANVINIYLVEGIVTPIAPGGSSPAAGYAASGSDLIVVNKGDFVGMVTVHEMGHFFGLPHTFDGSGELVIRSNNCYTNGDGFCDTDADPFPIGMSSSQPCSFQPGPQDAQGQYYTPPLDNIMSYWDCTTRFTQEQYNWMSFIIVTVKNYLH